ncbi:hypothetical protein [Sinorhizobium fredii]|uniref:hypothetical protein n=1 Tax=Rhizobium fredii TaxID=380 RepID=UPI003397A06B
MGAVSIGIYRTQWTGGHKQDENRYSNESRCIGNVLLGEVYWRDNGAEWLMNPEHCRKISNATSRCRHPTRERQLKAPLIDKKRLIDVPGFAHMTPFPGTVDQSDASKNLPFSRFS